MEELSGRWHELAAEDDTLPLKGGSGVFFISVRILVVLPIPRLSTWVPHDRADRSRELIWNRSFAIGAHISESRGAPVRVGFPRRSGGGCSLHVLDGRLTFLVDLSGESTALDSSVLAMSCEWSRVKGGWVSELCC